MNRGRFIVGTIVGAMAGLVAGLLTAPKTGKETRADLKQKAKDLKKKAGRETKTLQRGAVDLAGDVTDRLREQKDRGEAVVDNAKHNLLHKR